MRRLAAGRYFIEFQRAFFGAVDQHRAIYSGFRSSHIKNDVIFRLPIK